MNSAIHNPQSAIGRGRYSRPPQGTPPRPPQISDRWYMIDEEDEENPGKYSATHMHFDDDIKWWRDYDPEQRLESIYEANGRTGVETGTMVIVHAYDHPTEANQFYLFDAADASAVIRFGKATGNYTHDDNTLTVNPCDHDGGNVDTETTVTCYIVSPQGYTRPPNVKISLGDVVGYMPFGAGTKGLLLPTPLYIPLLDGLAHYDTKAGAVEEDDLIAGIDDDGTIKWTRFAKGAASSILITNESAHLDWLEKTENGVLGCTDSVLGWITGGSTYQVMQKKSGGTIGFDWVRAH